MNDKEQRDYKTKVLGIPIATANSRLRKMLLFDFAKRCNEDICYRCNIKIENIDDFSIEHKQAWLHHPKAKELFFDLNNISFSHIACNSSAEKLHKNGVSPNKGKPSSKRIIPPAGTLWCYRGKHFQPTELFTTDNSTWTGKRVECNPCRSVWRKERYKQGKSR